MSVRIPCGIVEVVKTHVYSYNSMNFYLYATSSQYMVAPVVGRRSRRLAAKVVGRLSCSEPLKLAVARGALLLMQKLFLSFVAVL